MLLFKKLPTLASSTNFRTLILKAWVRYFNNKGDYKRYLPFLLAIRYLLAAFVSLYYYFFFDFYKKEMNKSGRGS